MKSKWLLIPILNLFLLAGWMGPVFALGHTQRDGLFKMDVPEGWHWEEFPEEVVITFPDRQTMAIDIQWVASRKLSPEDIKKIIKEGNDKMIKQGIEAHHGNLIDEKVTSMDGLYATQLDFKTAPPASVYVTYISFFNKGYAFTITYGSRDDNMRLTMDDAVASFRFK